MTTRGRIVAACLLACGPIIAAGSAPLADGPARLLNDINRNPSWEMGSFPHDFVRFENLALFMAWSRETGYEPWRSDGTVDGTFRLADIRPGPGHGVWFGSSLTSFSFSPVIAGGRAYFMADDGVHGWELWTTDGTSAGTRLVKEIRPGTAGPFDGRYDGSEPTLVWETVVAGGILYFAADDGAHGFELWRSDGTEAGTRMLEDITPGAGGAFGATISGGLSGFEALGIGSIVYFSASDGLLGSELWKSDGTSAGTVLVRDINPGPDASVPAGPMLNLHGSILFWALGAGGTIDPWISDGTYPGTRIAGSFPSSPISRPNQAIELNGIVLFTLSGNLYRTSGSPAGSFNLGHLGTSVRFLGVMDGAVLMSGQDAAHGPELWRSDGTVAGTRMIKDIRPGTAGSGPSGLSVSGSRAFFAANDGVHGRELWTTDGTGAGTRLVDDLSPGAPDSGIFVLAAGPVAFYKAVDGNGTGWLWSLDAAGETIARLPMAGSTGDAVLASDGALLFPGYDAAHGSELWRSDGSAGGVGLLKDLNPIVRNDSSVPVVMGPVCVPGRGPAVLFEAREALNGVADLWVTDGTPRGTRKVADSHVATGRTGVNCPTGLEGAHHYVDSDGEHGSELWRSDGTAEGTCRVIDLNPGTDAGLWEPPVRFNGSLYLAGFTGEGGMRLYRSDGTEAGTVPVMETFPGVDLPVLQQFFVAGDLLYFLVFDQDYVNQIWRTDGTPEGTFQLADPSTASGPWNPGFIASAAGRAYFVAWSSSTGYELWVSDGTPAGTHPVMDIRPGPGGSVSGNTIAAPLGDILYFGADDGIHGRELWRTDGTAAGTFLVKDVWPGSRSSGFTALIPIDGTLHFDAVTSTAFENELWSSDGTEEGTAPYITGLGPNVYNFTGVTGGFVFVAEDVPHGRELWRSDGTAAGTKLAQDLAPGPVDSRPRDFIELAGRIYFMADHPEAGFELWAARTSILMNRPDRAILELRDEVAMRLPDRGPRTSLLAMLDGAAAALERGRGDHAVTSLEVFRRHVEVLAPRWLSDDSATSLTGFAGEIASLLER